MHIAINCRSFSKKQFTGIGRYASSLVESLTQVDTVNRYSLYTTRGWRQVHQRIHPQDLTRLSRRAGNFSLCFDWLKRGIAKSLKAADIYHAPSPEIIGDIPARVVVTVHDLVYKTYPQSHTSETIVLSQEQFCSFIPRASKIICSSKNTLNDLKKYFPEVSNKACFIHQGVDQGVFYPLSQEDKAMACQLLRARGLDGAFLLFVGTIEPRKNLAGLLEAYAQLKRQKVFIGKLAVVGMVGWKSQGIVELIERLGIKEDVIFLGFISNEELRILYNLAEVFVFPSFYEGFGYPIIEAMSCGAVVVTSNVSSCPELAGDAAITVDPHDVEAIGRAISSVIDDEKLKDTLRQKAIRRAQEFDNLKTARETLAVYKEVYSTH